MPRLNIEERFFAESKRYEVLAKMMGWENATAAGRLLFLWHNSQSAGKWEADAEEICIWSDVYSDRDKYINVLCHKVVHYLDLKPSGIYIIRGNQKQIDGLNRFSDRAKKAADTRWSKKKQVLAPDATSIQIDAPSIEIDAQACANHANTSQDNTNQDKTILNTHVVADAPEHCENQSLVLIPVSEEKPKRKRRPKRDRELTWSDEHPFARIFALLCSFDEYKRVFDVPKDNAKLTSYREHYKLNDVELYQLIFGYVEYYQDDKKEMRSPRGALTGWLNRYKERKDDKEKNVPSSKAKQKAEAVMNEEFKEKIESW